MVPLLLGLFILPAVDPAESGQWRKIRIATFNTSLHRDSPGKLITDLQQDDPQARQIATIIQTVRPDVILLNEFDFDPANKAADLFRQNYLAVNQEETSAIQYPHVFARPVNTGVPTGLDLDDNQRIDDPADAFGFGRHPGQYGMLVLSKLPIDTQRVRTFQKFLWREMPNALLPTFPSSQQSFYTEEALQILRLSSKSHWDLPLRIGNQSLHFLVCHPTPPVFDGPEDRNGRRNFDEIRLWADYVHPDSQRSAYLRDDQGGAGGLASDAKFVIAGDLNADPVDGASRKGSIEQLLYHPRVNATLVPVSQQGQKQSQIQGAANHEHRGNPAHDTADFPDRHTGNLRVDYVLPSKGLQIRGGGVYWPKQDNKNRTMLDASDHRLVWIDLQLNPSQD